MRMIFSTRKGMSLVEMMMAIFIVLIAMEGFTILFVRSWDMNKYVLESGMASMAASRAVNQVVSDLRKAKQADNADYPLVLGDDFDITFYANVDTDTATERVHYYLAGEALWKGTRDPDASIPPVYAAGDASTVKVADYIMNTSGDPAFVYFDDTYPANTTPLSTPVIVNGPRLVKVHLLVNIDPVHAPNNINVESFAELRNLNDYEN